MKAAEGSFLPPKSGKMSVVPFPGVWHSPAGTRKDNPASLCRGKGPNLGLQRMAPNRVTAGSRARLGPTVPAKTQPLLTCKDCPERSCFVASHSSLDTDPCPGLAAKTGQE